MCDILFLLLLLCVTLSVNRFGFCRSLCCSVTVLTNDRQKNPKTFAHFNIRQKSLVGTLKYLHEEASRCTLLCVHLSVTAIVFLCLSNSVCSPTCSDLHCSQQAGILTAPCICLLRSAVLVTYQRCPCSKWNLTVVSSSPHTLCRWPCNQLSQRLNRADCSSTLRYTEQQNSNCFFKT